MGGRPSRLKRPEEDGQELERRAPGPVFQPCWLSRPRSLPVSWLGPRGSGQHIPQRIFILAFSFFNHS